MTMRGTYRTQVGTPVPIAAKEQADKLGGKVMLSVDFETGEIKWDKEWMDKMGTAKLDINKVDFIRAIKNNRTQAEAIKELGISVGSFYKFKQLWAADITAAMDTPRTGIIINKDFDELFDKPVAAVVDQEPVLCPEEPHVPTQAETESFFGESTFNPDEPAVVVERGQKMNVLQAVDMMERGKRGKLQCDLYF